MNIKNIKIGTWNVENSCYNLKANDKKVNAVINLLLLEDLDILALQEVNPLLAKKIEDRLKYLRDGYTISTPIKKTLNPISNLKVENNIIISRLTPGSVGVNTSLSVRSKGFSLAKDFNKESLVTQIFNIEDKKIILNVTNLGHSNEELRGRQMYKIIEEINLESVFSNDIILMGNLSKLDNFDITYYTERLSDYGLQIIESNNEDNNKLANYIIMPKDWEMENAMIVDYGFNKISSHSPVIVEITKN